MHLNSLFKDVEISACKIKLTSNVIEYIRSFIKNNNDKFLGIRISIVSGGCYGMQYKIALNKIFNTNDVVVFEDEIPIIFSKRLENYIDKLTIDYVNSELSSGFRFIRTDSNNCSCGKSLQCK